MLEIGVNLPSNPADTGEWLAEARALEAAGATSLWVEPGDELLDHWALLAALATVTEGCRLGYLRAWRDPQPDEQVLRGALTVDLVSRGRLLVALPPGRLARQLTRPDPDLTVLTRVGSSEPVPETGPAVGLWEGPAAGERWRREDSAEALWVQVAAPPDRDAWRRTRAALEAAGATGLIVAHYPGLLDLLRNPDQEDDRMDLQLAQG